METYEILCNQGAAGRVQPGLGKFGACLQTSQGLYRLCRKVRRPLGSTCVMQSILRVCYYLGIPAKLGKRCISSKFDNVPPEGPARISVPGRAGSSFCAWS